MLARHRDAVLRARVRVADRVDGAIASSSPAVPTSAASIAGWRAGLGAMHATTSRAASTVPSAPRRTHAALRASAHESRASCSVA